MGRLLRSMALLVLAIPSGLAGQQHSVTGLVLSVDRTRLTFTASVRGVPGVMPAMAMPFKVRQRNDLDGLVPGAAVEFVLVVNGNSSHAARVHVVRDQSADQDPLAANRLRLLTRLAGVAPPDPVAVGETVPDFTLIDQTGRPVTLSGLRGKVVAVNFVYTSCVLPNLCLRLANDFGVLQRRFKGHLGRDLVLLTVTFDPTHDTPDVLARYALRWDADPAVWHFLTGEVPEVRRVCRLFGVDVYPDEGLMNHGLHTVIVDRRGTVFANVEGNAFTADQLADLVDASLRSQSQGARIRSSNGTF